MENNNYKDKIMTALDSLEKTLNKGIDKVKEGFFNKIINEEIKGDDFYDVCKEVKYVVKSLDCCFEDEMYIM